MKKIELTPQLAASYLANIYPRQRKVSRPRVAEYSRAIREGRWRPFNPSSPIMLDHKTGQMFNGRQRCTAVVSANMSIEVYLDDEHDADTYFDVIDTELGRNASQFIMSSRASVRAAAARVILWHEQAFDQPLSKLMNRWQMHEVRVKADELDDEFETWIAMCSQAYETTHLSGSVMLAASVLAAKAGHSDEVQEFLEKLIEPAGLDLLDPAYVLHRKMNNVITFKRRRVPQQDWLLFVRCLNAVINDEELPSNLHVNVSVWPDVGDTEADIKRKIGRAASSRAKATRIERRVRAEVEAQLRASETMAASGPEA